MTNTLIVSAFGHEPDTSLPSAAPLLVWDRKAKLSSSKWPFSWCFATWFAGTTSQPQEVKSVLWVVPQIIRRVGVWWYPKGTNDLLVAVSPSGIERARAVGGTIQITEGDVDAHLRFAQLTLADDFLIGVTSERKANLILDLDDSAFQLDVTTDQVGAFLVGDHRLTRRGDEGIDWTLKEIDGRVIKRGMAH